MYKFSVGPIFGKYLMLFFNEPPAYIVVQIADRIKIRSIIKIVA